VTAAHTPSRTALPRSTLQALTRESSTTPCTCTAGECGRVGVSDSWCERDPGLNVRDRHVKRAVEIEESDYRDTSDESAESGDNEGSRREGREQQQRSERSKRVKQAAKKKKRRVCVCVCVYVCVCVCVCVRARAVEDTRFSRSDTHCAIEESEATSEEKIDGVCVQWTTALLTWRQANRAHLAWPKVVSLRARVRIPARAKRSVRVCALRSLRAPSVLSCQTAPRALQRRSLATGAQGQGTCE
jgi:hypothetical protein